MKPATGIGGESLRMLRYIFPSFHLSSVLAQSHLGGQSDKVIVIAETSFCQTLPL